MSGVRVAGGCSSLCSNRFYRSIIIISDNADASSQDDDDYAVIIVLMLKIIHGRAKLLQEESHLSRNSILPWEAALDKLIYKNERWKIEKMAVILVTKCIMCTSFICDPDLFILNS